jgi:ribonuclease HII
MAAIYEEAAAWGIGWASAAEIDAVNILRASLLAMRRAFEALAAAFGPVRAIPPDGDDSRSAPGLYVEEAVVDGIYVPDIPLPCRALVKADSLVPEVMAASILAKTARDRTMERYSWLYPDYGYERHKGYPTREHREIITRLGPSPIQRMSFKTR